MRAVRRPDRPGDRQQCLYQQPIRSRRGLLSRPLPCLVRPALQSVRRDEFSLYGRFDLAFDGSSPPRLLECNADTPTALLEASVAQWFWLQQLHPDADQFNSIHERLIEAWRRWAGTTIHFSSIKDHAEDEQTVLYLRDACEQAGAKRVGDRLSLDGSLATITELLLSTLRQTEQDDLPDMANGTVFYGFTAHSRTGPILARWHEDNVMFYRGQTMSTKEVEKGFSVRPAR